MTLSATSPEGSTLRDGTTFFLYNKHHDGARCAINSNNKELVAYGGQLYPDQLWTLEKDDANSGKFYIVNSFFTTYRIALESHNNTLVSIEGEKNSDQLWKFEKQDDGSYIIVNNRDPEYRITMLDSNGSIKMVSYNGPRYEDQNWWLVSGLKIVNT